MNSSSGPLVLLCFYLVVMSMLGIYIVLKEQQKVKTPIELREEINRQWISNFFSINY
jgi:hypothetical protein